MKALLRTSIILVHVGGMAACSNTDGSSNSTMVIDSNEALVTGPANDGAMLEGINEALGQDNNRNLRVTTRSSQGIANNGNDRRSDVRGRREQNQTNDPLMVDNTEVRSYDGSGNNLNFSDWGSTFSHLQRVGIANYSDGTSSMIFTDRAGAREISNTIVNQDDEEDILDPLGTSDFSWQWGQFLDHDLDLTDGGADEPQDIPVPIGDRYFDPDGTGTAVNPFSRALYDPDTGSGASNVREQENEITSWLDGSMVYGSTNERAAAIGEGQDSPFLKTSAGNLLPFNTENSLTPMDQFLTQLLFF